MNIKDVTLGKMAVASLLFNTLTPYNPSLTDFRSVVGSAMDLSIQEHRDALMNWLNNWGCRHLSKEQHQVASASIFDWYQSNFGTLFGDKMSLWQLDSQDIETAAKVYGSLKDKTGAWRMGGNSKRKVHIGPTGSLQDPFCH
ncbi:MAG: hypothetical protein R6U93_08715 [Dehalococcoidia bacterium]